MGTAPCFSLTLNFVPLNSALRFRWKQSAKDQGPIFLNMGEVLRAHDRILGEQNSAVHFLEKFSQAIPYIM